MSDDNDETVILASAMRIFLDVHYCNNGLKRKRRHILGYLQFRVEYGAHNYLLRYLQVHAEDKLKCYIRMDLSTFGVFSLEEWMIGFV